MNGNVPSESKEEVKEVRNNILELCMMGNCACFICPLQIFFCVFLDQMRTDFFSGLICVKTKKSQTRCILWDA